MQFGLLCVSLAPIFAKYSLKCPASPLDRFKDLEFFPLPLISLKVSKKFSFYNYTQALFILIVFSFFTDD